MRRQYRWREAESAIVVRRSISWPMSLCFLEHMLLWRLLFQLLPRDVVCLFSDKYFWAFEDSFGQRKDSSFTINEVYGVFGEYSWLCPTRMMRRSHHALSECMLPAMEASSAYQACLVLSFFSLLMSGIKLMAYMALAKGSPWVVLSYDRKWNGWSVLSYAGMILCARRKEWSEWTKR